MGVLVSCSPQGAHPPYPVLSSFGFDLCFSFYNSPTSKGNKRMGKLGDTSRWWNQGAGPTSSGGLNNPGVLEPTSSVTVRQQPARACSVPGTALSTLPAFPHWIPSAALGGEGTPLFPLTDKETEAWRT